MPRHVGVGPVHQRLVETGARNAGAQVVAHDLLRNAIEECEGIGVCADPIRQRLAPNRLGVRVAGSAKHRDEDFRPARLTGCPVEHFHGLAREVDEHPLARHMDLTQRWLQPSYPRPVEIAEPGIAKPIRGTRAVFFPQQRQRHVRPAQLTMNQGPVRHRPLIHRHVRRQREQQSFQLLVIEIVRHRPGNPGAACPAEIAVHCTGTELQAPRNSALAQAVSEPQA